MATSLSKISPPLIFVPFHERKKKRSIMQFFSIHMRNQKALACSVFYPFEIVLYDQANYVCVQILSANAQNINTLTIDKL